MSSDPEQPENHGLHQESQSAPSSGSSLPPGVILGFIIIAILGGLIALTMRSGSGDSAEVAELKAKEQALRADINAARSSAGLSPLVGGGEPIDEIAKRLKRDADTMAGLANSFQLMLTEKDAEISAKNAELIRSEQLRQTLTAETARLQSELQRALVAASDADLLRRNLEAMTSQRDALAAEIASLREQLATMKQGVSEEEFADLERRYEEAMRANDFLENRIKELEGEVSKARLFARSENELVPAAIELFRSLRKLENQPDSELTTAYSRFGTDLGANVLHTLSFATGSSELTPADQDTLRNLVADIPDGDLAFIVGYASETGNVDANQTLSSDRATTAAEFFSSLKRPGQQVQAVYLGQTDRFSSRIPERNQIVEVWRIRAKP